MALKSRRTNRPSHDIYWRGGIVSAISFSLFVSPFTTSAVYVSPRRCIEALKKVISLESTIYPVGAVDNPQAYNYLNTITSIYTKQYNNHYDTQRHGQYSQ